MYQKIILAGNLGTDPEMRVLPDGTPFTRFTLATHWRKSGGEKTTTWWRVTMWERQAEIAAEYLSRGRAVLVEGRMEPDPETAGPRLYERQNGTIGASYELRANRFEFLSSGDAGPQQDPAPQAQEPVEQQSSVPF
jgi:single-strand DNA-binding protein